jgi:hypothetical protein
MKKRTLFLTLFLILSLGSFPVYAQQQVFAIDGEPLKEGTIADTTAAIGFTAANLINTDAATGRIRQAKAVLFIAQTATITFTVTGTTPTIAAGTDAGIQITAGMSWVVKGWSAINKFRCINTSASSGAKLKYIVFF